MMGLGVAHFLSGGWLNNLAVGTHAEARVLPRQQHLLGVFSQASGLAQAGEDPAPGQLGDGRDVPAGDPLEGRGCTARIVEHALGDQGMERLAPYAAPTAADRPSRYAAAHP